MSGSCKVSPLRQMKSSLKSCWTAHVILIDKQRDAEWTSPDTLGGGESLADGLSRQLTPKPWKIQ